MKNSEKKQVSSSSDYSNPNREHSYYNVIAVKNLNIDGDTLLSWTSSESPTSMVLSPITSLDSQDTELMGYTIIQHGATTFGFEKYTGSFGTIWIFPVTIYSELI